MSGKKRAPENTYWRGDTLYGKVTIKGATHRWSLRTDDPAVARKRVQEFKREAVAAAHYGDERRRFDAVLEAWAAHIPAQIAPSTIFRYGVSLKLMQPVLEGLYLDQIDKRVIADIIGRRRESGAGTATIRRDLSALNSVLNFAIDEGWMDLEDNPVEPRLRRLKERRDPIILPDHADIEAVAKRARGMFGYLIRAALLTGCRQNELVTAERRHLNLAAKQLSVIGKGNKLRTVSLSDEACALFRSMPVHMTAKHLFWRRGGELLARLPNRFASLVQGAVRAQKAAHRFRFHDLRHRYAVDYLKAGKNIYDLKVQLGHSSVRTTEIYLRYLTAEEGRVAKFGKGTLPDTAAVVSADRTG